MDKRLKQQLDFVLEIDKEKNILRQTHLSGHGRRENDAEHAWHMAIMSYLLREYSNESVDIAKVMLMCLIHDIVEIDAGDTFAYDVSLQGPPPEQGRQSRCPVPRSGRFPGSRAPPAQQRTAPAQSLPLRLPEAELPREIKTSRLLSAMKPSPKPP